MLNALNISIGLDNPVRRMNPKKQLKKHVDYEQLINVLAMDKSRLEEELRATKSKLKLYDRLCEKQIGFALFRLCDEMVKKNNISDFDLKMVYDGGGMNPEGLRKCTSLGCSTKNVTTQSGNVIIIQKDEVNIKITKAYCPPNVVEGNPCLEYIRHIVFLWFKEFKVQELHCLYSRQRDLMNELTKNDFFNEYPHFTQSAAVKTIIGADMELIDSLPAHEIV
uniref:tyrosine--tRNA ligase n=1 Tax=Tanacetum cinerariifolium TaxID=118510 RepID=A0A6L2JCS6_TANCI|nr:tyrosine--tRNA ligase 1, cytoplasmic-like [Tanacetum cinerariifolium]